MAVSEHSERTELVRGVDELRTRHHCDRDIEYLLVLQRRKSIYYLHISLLNQKNQLHAVSRTQQGRQRKPKVKTLRSPLSAEFWSH